MSPVDEDIRRGRPRVTPAMEDYLRAAYRLGDEPGPISTQRLAEALGVSSPSVTNMVKRLHELGLVRHERYHGVELTEKGEGIAREVVRHHRLLERYLVESLGFPWDEAHVGADRLEHHVSPSLVARITVALDHPRRDDPHGDAIQPVGDAEVVRLLRMALA